MYSGLAVGVPKFFSFFTWPWPKELGQVKNKKEHHFRCLWQINCPEIMTFSKLVKVLQVQGQFFIWRSQNIFLKSSTMKLPTLKNIFPWFGGLLTEIEGWKSFSPPATFCPLKIGVVSENENCYWMLGRSLQWFFALSFVKILSLEKKLWPPYPKLFWSIKGQGQGQGQCNLPSTTFPDLIHLVTKFGPEIL